MAPAASSRRNRGCGLAAALALGAVCQLVGGPLGFLSASGRQQPRPRAALVGLRQNVGRSPFTAMAARGGGRPDMTLNVGDKVKAQSPDDEMWYPGRIQESQGGNWVVLWDDPDGGPETNTLGEDCIKKLFFYKDYQAGDDCKAVSPDDDRWYPGTVAEVLGDNKFRVKWDDPDGGDETADVNFESMKRVKVKRDYQPGDEVLAKFPEDFNMYEAKVVKQNADGTFQVKWDDPDGGPEESDVSPKDMKVPPIPFDSLEVGQKYTGFVTGIRDFGAFVDIGAEGEGLLHISSITRERVEDIYEHLEEDQEVEVWIKGLRDDGKFGVTMIEGQKDLPPRPNYDLGPFADLSPDEWHEGEVVSTAPFGAFVLVKLDSGEEAQGLVHISQITDSFVDNVDDHVSAGQEVKVRVQSVDLDANKMSLSMKEGFGGGGGFGARAPADLSPFEGIESSTWLDGKVARTAPFGAFVTVTAPNGATADGLVHITQIASGFVENVEDHAQPGQEVKVRVVNLDMDAGKMGLSMKEEGDDFGGGSREPADLSPFEGIDSNEWLEGKVLRTAPFGAFVEATAPDGATAEGLVHITQLSDEFVESVEDFVQAGQEVKVRVVNVDMEGGKMGLSMKEEGSGGGREPIDLGPFEGIDSSTWLEGKVVRTAPFGAFVNVQAPDGATADGLVHITQLKDGFVESVEDEVEIGQEVKVRVVEVDVGSGKMGLSMKEEGDGEE